ncbi:DUF1616 domain-containing protein [Natrarchaeobius chitinivorans]|uniref:DUF1616 domain-containing protein n=1 Tax=Natrarchaeobius chitinivorans TaxID=1679083 RepID=A0A3N6MJC7_NATCH|nr:DUF1616 domain-containing protein [Natrarchaeobius chitinivorans]RQG97180.1 DUF1616 domain-containing protein [Natrarchaeobius chitinivorans]
MKDRSTQPFQPLTTVRQGSKQLAAQVPTDLGGVAAFVTVSFLVLTVLDTGSPFVRVIVGFPLLLFVPGYATVSALFPRAPPNRNHSPTQNGSLRLSRNSVTVLERVALAFGLSLAVLPLLGLVIAAFSWEFSTPVAVTVVCVYALSTVSIAAIRRSRVPVEDRYQFSLTRSASTVYAAIFDTRTTFHTAINVVLVVSMLLALTTVGYALVSPQDGEQYSSLQVLTEDDSGDLVADGPSQVEPDESMEFVIGIENQEGEETEYTAVVQEQWINDGEIVERHELDRIETTVSDGETVHGDQSVTPVASDGDVRIVVLLYEGEVPDAPTTADAYRYTYFWTEITDDDATTDGE